MTDLDALYRAVLDHPDDDTLRLIYADALEDAGQSERAEFIRSEVAAAAVPEYDPVAIRARHRARGNAAREGWLDAPPRLPSGLNWAKEPFRRGLPAAVRAPDGGTFAAHADELFAAYPIESLELAAVRPSDPHDLSECRWLSRITRLSLPAGIGRSIANRLLHRTQNLDRLTDLYIGPGLTTPLTASSVVQSRAFWRLTAFAYRDERRGGAMVNELTRLADPPPFERLDLAGNRIAAGSLTRLIAAPTLATVKALDLSDNNLSAEGMRVLAGARLPLLRRLRLVHVWPEGDGVRALAEAELLKQLRSLDLSGNNLGPHAGEVLAGSPFGANLQVLDLGHNRLGDEGALALANSTRLTNLLYLDLADNVIEDTGAEGLARSPALDGLIVLDLSGNIISEQGRALLQDRFGERVTL